MQRPAVKNHERQIHLTEEHEATYYNDAQPALYPSNYCQSEQPKGHRRTQSQSRGQQVSFQFGERWLQTHSVRGRHAARKEHLVPFRGLGWEHSSPLQGDPSGKGSWYHNHSAGGLNEGYEGDGRAGVT